MAISRRGKTQEETTMSINRTFALAQAGSGSGATVPENSGAAVNGGSGVVGTTTGGSMNNGTTGTGIGSKHDASRW
jgi:hypothetical protein